MPICTARRCGSASRSGCVRKSVFRRWRRWWRRSSRMWSACERGSFVDKTELEKLKDPELRALAKKAGVTELLGRDELIARLLAEEPPAPAKKEAKPAKESKETV